MTELARIAASLRERGEYHKALEIELLRFQLCRLGKRIRRLEAPCLLPVD